MSFVSDERGVLYFTSSTFQHEINEPLWNTFRGKRVRGSWVGREIKRRHVAEIWISKHLSCSSKVIFLFHLSRNRRTSVWGKRPTLIQFVWKCLRLEQCQQRPRSTRPSRAFQSTFRPIQTFKLEQRYRLTDHMAQILTRHLSKPMIFVLATAELFKNGISISQNASVV